MKKRNNLPAITTVDGHEISYIYECAEEGGKANTIVVVTHGIFTDKREKGRFDRLSERLRDAKLDVFRFDFRGHGESHFHSARFTLSGALTDYFTVLNWVEQLKYNQIAVIGSSFGGGIVLLERLLPQPKEIASVVLLNPVLDYEATFLNPLLEWGKGIIDIKKIKRIQTEGKATLTDTFEGSIDFLNEMCLIRPLLGLNNFENPILILHGDKDDKVPLEPAKQIAEHSSKLKLEVVQGAAHAFKDPDKEAYVHKRTIDWILESIELRS